MTAASGREPLIVEAVGEDFESWDNVEGAGVLSSWADLGSSLGGPDRDPGAIVSASAGAGLDALGAVMNPLGALATAGVGWLIEHLAFLHEPLDWLAGDPTQITAQAHTWHNMSAELGAVAEQYRRSAAGLTGWDGAAVASYRETVARYTATVSEASAHAEDLAQTLTTTGAMVGTVRATIRDLIADKVGTLLGGAIAAVAAGPVTAGGSLAEFTAYAVVQASAAADEISEKITRLLAKLSAAADALAGMARRFAATAAAVARGLHRVESFPAHIDGRLVSDLGGPGPLSRYLDGVSRPPPDPDGFLPGSAGPGHPVSDLLEGGGARATVEYGKQGAQARQERASFTQ